MARTLIWNTSASAQTLPAAYGGGTVQPGYGWIVADESSVAVATLGGFADMHGKWAVSAISTDEALGSVDMSAAGVALISDVVTLMSSGGGGGGGGPVTWTSITGKPTFATVATSGQYSDLSNKPALATVATSGLYADLSGTPDIPVAGNATPTAISSVGGAGVATVWARGDHQHAHGNLNGGSLHSTATSATAGFMSASDKSKLDGLAAVATTGSYADLSGTPVLAPVATSGAYADLSGTPTLAPVATSGSYADLTGTPILSSVASTGSYEDLTATPSLAPVATTGAYADLSGKPSLAAVATSGAYADLSGKPTLATVATSGAYADLSGTPSLAAVATSGNADDLANQPYDFMFNAAGSLAVGKVLTVGIAPRALVLESLQQGSGDTAQVTLKINGTTASFPQSVTAGALITAVVSTAGTDCYFSIKGKVA